MMQKQYRFIYDFYKKPINYKLIQIFERLYSSPALNFKFQNNTLVYIFDDLLPHSTNRINQLNKTVEK